MQHKVLSMQASEKPSTLPVTYASTYTSQLTYNKNSDVWDTFDILSDKE